MRFKKVSVLVPTRGRVERLKTLLESFEQTTAGRAELWFRVDDDDVKTQKALRNRSYVIGPRLDGYKSTPHFFNELYAVCSGDVLMAGNDDMVFKTLGWDERILKEADLYPEGLFDFGVLTHNAPNFPFATVSRAACDALGFFFDPRFFWGDIFWRDVMSHFGRAIPLPSVQIDHDWVGFEPDRIFAAGERTRRADHSQYHAVAVAEAVGKLEALWSTSASRS
ncbi:MAG: glycosyltransferase family A protein [Gemmatimonadota bacterium]